MVNAIKVQQEILKSPSPIGGTLPDGKVYLSFDGVAAFVLMEEACKIDLKKIKQMDFIKYFSNIGSAKAVLATGTIKTIMMGKSKQLKCAEFQDGDGELVYIQEKYLKYFDKNTSFKCSGYYMFAVDQHDDVCGLICTVRNYKK